MRDISLLLGDLGERECSNHELWEVQFFRLHNEKDRERFSILLKQECDLRVYDKLRQQLAELVKIRHPQNSFTREETDEIISTILKEKSAEEYGVWVYYPWSKNLVHLLDEQEFIELRSSRNLYKIQPEERDVLLNKKIGIIGLSVGQSIALALAMERVCGELRLADFDTLDLSNLNRLRTGVQNLGLRKTVIAAREIAEIDPFIKIKIFNEGVNEENIDTFMIGESPLDILVDECDSLDIKVLCRYKARSYGIPVIMDTNDRGMLDIERFDLEPERPVLHGLIESLQPADLKNLSNKEKLPYVLKIVDAENISERLKFSMNEFGKSITAWPQLASAVFLGGALGADTCRRILLKQINCSGRYYIDLDQLVA